MSPGQRLYLDTPCCPCLQAGWLLHTPGDLPVDQLNAEHVLQLLSTVPEAARVRPLYMLIFVPSYMLMCVPCI